MQSVSGDLLSIMRAHASRVQPGMFEAVDPYTEETVDVPVSLSLTTTVPPTPSSSPVLSPIASERLSELVTSSSSAIESSVFSLANSATVTYDCKACGTKCDTPSALSAHIDQAHRPKHKCVDCGDEYKDMRRLMIHRRKKHAAEAPLEQPRPPVVTSFSSFPMHALKPLESDASDDPYFTCNICNMRFMSAKAFAGHVEYSHKNKYKCPECNADFGDISSMQRHRRLKHLVEPDTPPLRPMSEDNQQPKRLGTPVESTRMPAIPPIELPPSVALSGETNIISWSISDLSTSKADKTDEAKSSPRPTNSLVCRYCNATFTRTYNLNRHERLHRNLIPIYREQEEEYESETARMPPLPPL